MSLSEKQLESRGSIWALTIVAIGTYAYERGLAIEYTKTTVDDEKGWWMQLGDSPEAKRFYPDSYWLADADFALLADRRHRDVKEWIDEVADYAVRAEEPVDA